MERSRHNSIKILHSADWHVCSEHYRDAQACLDFLVNYVLEIPKPLDLIVIPGDIYNHRQIQQETESARLAHSTIKGLAAFAPVVIMTGTPSHDGKAPLLLHDIGGLFPVLVVDIPSQWVLFEQENDLGTRQYFAPLDHKYRDDTVPKAVISCTPAFTKQHFESGSDIATSDAEIADALGGIFAKFGSDYNDFQRKVRHNPPGDPVPHIGLGHYSIGGAFIHPSQPMIGYDIEVSTYHMAMANTTINCMGHIHAAQKVGENTWYSGSLFATDAGETETKGFLIHEMKCLDFGHHWEVVKTTQVETPSPTLVKISIDLILNPVEDKDLLLQSILIKAEDIDTEADNGWNTVVRMEIKAYQDEAHLIDEDAIKEYFGELQVRSFDLAISRIPRPNVRSARIMEADRLRDKVSFRAEIVGHEISASIYDKADTLQDETEDGLSALMNIRIEKEKSRHEITES